MARTSSVQVTVKRYALYEEFTIPGDEAWPAASGEPALRRLAGKLLPFAGRAALAAGVTLLPLFAVRLAGVAGRRALGPGRPPALPPSHGAG